jgi:hypothetical protein
MRPKRRRTVTAAWAGDSHDSEPHCLPVLVVAAVLEMVLVFEDIASSLTRSGVDERPP